MKRLVLLFVGFFSLLMVSYGQKVTISGTVTAKEDGLPIIGASVVEKGTTNGTITNFDGFYSISVSNGAILEFSYVGMDKQEKKIAGATTLNVVLSSSAIAIDELVVTAMGIVSEKKKLNFSVQSVDASDLTAGKQTNFVNALQGRIAGVEVAGQGGSPSGSSQIIIRGISSINNAQNNEPLFIIDGIPISGGATKAAEINPNDIENVTILKGAAAAALYGQEASNGVIMINTKKGVIGQVKVEAGMTLQLDEPFKVPEIQQSYINGAQGVYTRQSGGGWGPKLREGEQTYDNINNYLQTGNLQKYDFSMSGGSEKFTVFASAEYSKHNGIIPKDFLERYGIFIKSNFKIGKKINAELLANIVTRITR
jgi:TonB-dependent SusC/RagA subfamily outer membrane receptor